MPNVDDDPYFDIAQCIKQILDAFDQERNIWTLLNVPFSCDSD